MHLKRQKIPNKWPIPRKGTKYVIRPASNIKEGIPMLILLRDILGVVQNKKELKKAIHQKLVLLNGKRLLDEHHSAVLFDKITLVPSKKNFEVSLSGKGKFKLEEIKDTEAHEKIAKVENKKMLKGKRLQLNLSDGRNFISEVKCTVDDSVLINLKEKKIQKCLPLKEKANVIVFAGKHLGSRGIVNKIDLNKKMVELDVGKAKVNVLIKQLMVVE